jgi:hypothetical protein
MKTIEVKRSDIEATARKLAAELAGKMLPLKGCNSLGQSRGIAIIPATTRGGQFAINEALAIVTEAAPA